MVLLHGIMGSRRNLRPFAERLLAEHPAWRVLLVDLRCHGESAGAIHGAPRPPHTVASAAGDVLRLLAHLRLFPEAIIGHSFGAKVAVGMASQFAKNAGARGGGASSSSSFPGSSRNNRGTNGFVPRLPHPVQVWALDAPPAASAVGVASTRSGSDHPRDLIAALSATPLPIASRSALVQRLTGLGFSAPVAAWSATNLRPRSGSDPRGALVWACDLSGIADLYASFEGCDQRGFAFADDAPHGLRLHYVQAQHSAFSWPGEDLAQLRRAGHAVHFLPNSGHWVHTDNPSGLAALMAGPLAAATPRELLAPGREKATTNILAAGWKAGRGSATTMRTAVA